MDTFFRSNPGLSSRIAHHLDFPDYPAADLLEIADKMLEQQNYRFGPGAREALGGISRSCASRSRTSPTRAACATRSIAPGCARRAGCLPRPQTGNSRPKICRRSPNPIFARAACSSPPPPAEARFEGVAMHLGRTTLSKFLIQQLRDIDGAGDLGALLVDVAAAVKAISAMTAKGALGGYLGEHGGNERAGRDAAEARRAGERRAHQELRMGRTARRHGLRGARRALSDTRRISARPLPAGVRSARRLLQHRRQCLGGHDLLGAARTTSRSRRRPPIFCSRARSRWPPAMPSTARRPCW